MVIFHSYVQLPEGIHEEYLENTQRCLANQTCAKQRNKFLIQDDTRLPSPIFSLVPSGKITSLWKITFFFNGKTHYFYGNLHSYVNHDQSVSLVYHKPMIPLGSSQAQSLSVSEKRLLRLGLSQLSLASVKVSGNLELEVPCGAL